MNTSRTVSEAWRPRLVSFWTRASTEGTADTTDSVVLELEMPSDRALDVYGAPPRVWLNYSAARPGSASAAGPGHFDPLLLEVCWQGKAATRLPESTWLEVWPHLAYGSLLAGPAPLSVCPWLGRRGVFFFLSPKVNARSSGLDQTRRCGCRGNQSWRMLVDKMGSRVDTGDVVKNGGAALHGVDPHGGITWEAAGRETEPQFRVVSLDAGLVAPGANRNIWNYSA